MNRRKLLAGLLAAPLAPIVAPVAAATIDMSHIRPVGPALTGRFVDPHREAVKAFKHAHAYRMGVKKYGTLSWGMMQERYGGKLSESVVQSIIARNKLFDELQYKPGPTGDTLVYTDLDTVERRILGAMQEIEDAFDEVGTVVAQD